MKQNIWKILFAVLLTVVIVCAITFGITWNVFHQSGVHIIGNKAHIALHTHCYFF